jgi:hypothetical protein
VMLAVIADAYEAALVDVSGKRGTSVDDPCITLRTRAIA